METIHRALLAPFNVLKSLLRDRIPGMAAFDAAMNAWERDRNRARNGALAAHLDGAGLHAQADQLRG